MTKLNNKNPWYIAGIHFECTQCTSCCSGPAEGYIWITKPEIEMLADFLKISIDQLRVSYLKRVGIRTSITEDQITKDCIFLREIDSKKGCTIYPVRPNQCRTWPFWPENLATPNTFNDLTNRCPGINRGKFFSFEEIEKIRKQKKWW